MLLLALTQTGSHKGRTAEVAFPLLALRSYKTGPHAQLQDEGCVILPHPRNYSVAEFL
jgi:hypothetical protein